MLLAWTGCIADRTPKDIDAATLVRAGDTAPDFTTEMLDGGTTTLSALRGEVVLLTFWASWCPECGREMEVVQQQIVERFAQRPFVFLPVSRGETREAVEAFVEKHGIAFPVGLDPDGSIYRLYATEYVPRNILIDAQGVVAESTAGYTAEEFGRLADRIEVLLAPQ